MAKPEPMDKQDIENIVADAIDNAVDFVESEIAPDRIKAQRYFDGESDIGYEEGRSKVVSTKVRDTVRNIKPSLMRIFMSKDKAVEFVPKKPQDVPLAEQATQFINWSFMESGGYRLLHDAFHDALVRKNGILKVYWDDGYQGEIFSYDNLTDEEFAIIANEPEIEILEHSEEVYVETNEMGMEYERKEHELKIMRKADDSKVCIKSVPSEEFFIDRNATCLEDAYIVAHRTEERVGDLVAMGYDFDEVSELDGISSGSSNDDMEIYERKGYYEDQQDESEKDPSMKLVMITEAYMRMDVEGTGVPMLYRIVCGGTKHKVLDYEVWDEVPFAVFEVDPEPHAFYGRSIADILIEDQDAATSMLRGILDNVALTNNPRLEVMDDMVNMDDVLNNEIGAVVRSRQIGSVQPLAVPFVAGSTLPALQYLDMLSESKSGVSRASLGLDPDTLQNTSATAAKLAQQGGQGQIEVIARNLAESGMKRLFKLMLRLFVKNSPEEQMMRINGQFVPVDPRVWNTSMDVSVNVGLGTGQEDVKMSVLSSLLQIQLGLFQQGGFQNGIASLTNIRNTLAEMLDMSGFHNAEKFVQPMNPQIEQQLMQMQIQQQQQAAQQAAQQGNPAQAMIQAEQIRAQAKMQVDSAKIQAQQQTELAKLDAQQQAKVAELQMKQQHEMQKLQKELGIARMDDDRERDRMLQELYIRQAELMAEEGIALDTARIQAMQASN